MKMLEKAGHAINTPYLGDSKCIPEIIGLQNYTYFFDYV